MLVRQYTREWNIPEEGTRLAVRGNCFVSFIENDVLVGTTHNELELPDVTVLSSGSSGVRMSGTSKLKVARKRNDKTWTPSRPRSEKVSIDLRTDSCGTVKVEIDGIDYVKLPPMIDSRRGAAEVPLQCYFK
ncbi:hypothetical protein V8D89_011316 [Ganoderma adspersum]